jgi:hypothetical protein
MRMGTLIALALVVAAIVLVIAATSISTARGAKRAKPVDPSQAGRAGKCASITWCAADLAAKQAPTMPKPGSPQIFTPDQQAIRQAEGKGLCSSGSPIEWCSHRRRRSSSEYERSAELARSHRLHVLRLTTPLDQCARNLVWRRRARRDTWPSRAGIVAIEHEMAAEARATLGQDAVVEVCASRMPLRARPLLGTRAGESLRDHDRWRTSWGRDRGIWLATAR